MLITASSTGSAGVRQRDAERREAVLKRDVPERDEGDTQRAVESHPRVDAHGPEHGSEEEQRRHGTEPSAASAAAPPSALPCTNAYRNAGYSKGHGKSPCAAPSPTIRQLPTHASIRGRSGR